MNNEQPAPSESGCKRSHEEINLPPNQIRERDYILNADGTVLLDHKGAPVTVDKFLGTKPLRGVISSRAGPGGKKLEYMAGEVVTQTLNDAFGYDGWSMEVKDKTREETVKDEKGRYHVAYTATVRITLRRSGVFREDCGAGDAIDRSLGTASGHAIKSAITDAMKRAARHFGEKTGNALYNSGFKINNAPLTLKDAFEQFDVHRAKNRFGFDKDRDVPNQSNTASQQIAKQNASNTAVVKQETRTVQNNQTPYASNIPKPTPTNTYAKQQPQRGAMTQPVTTNTNTNNGPQKTPYTVNNNYSTAQSNAKPAASAHVTPYHGANGAAAANINRQNTGVSMDFSKFAATPATKSINAGNGINNSARISFDGAGKENSNPQQHTAPVASTGGLNLPPRPGTSRGQSSNNMDGMLGLASSILAMNGQTEPGAGVKRSNESLDGTARSKVPNNGVKNPYSALG